MRLVLDYGGVIVEHGDERDRAHLLDVDPGTDPYPGWLAYFAFRDGLVRRTAEYLDLLSTLTGASRGACREYLEATWLDPAFPGEHVAVLRELAADHTLVLFGNTARPWVETVLSEHGVLECFDELVVSSDLRRPKPHPDGYVECLPEGDEPVAFVSDEYNEDLLMGETFGMTSVWVENDGETPYREPDVRVSALADVPGVLAADGRTPFEQFGDGVTDRHESSPRRPGDGTDTPTARARDCSGRRRPYHLRAGGDGGRTAGLSSAGVVRGRHRPRVGLGERRRPLGGAPEDHRGHHGDDTTDHGTACGSRGLGSPLLPAPSRSGRRRPGHVTGGGHVHGPGEHDGRRS